jgi:adenosylhomocysteine nucleosidase
MIAVTFALPQESRAFRRAMRHPRASSAGPFTLGEIGRHQIILAHTGVGLDAAEDATKTLLRAHGPRLVIATGFAGGLDPGLVIGDLVLATNFSSPELLERSLPVADARSFFGAITSQAWALESVAHKADIAQQTKALAVDMETAAVAELCCAANVPLLAVRAISDTAKQALPVPFDQWFNIEEQRPRPGRLAAFLVKNPGRILPFTRFVAGLPRCRRALTSFVVRFLAALPE